MSLAEEAAVCLRAQDIDDDDGGISGGRQDRGLSTMRPRDRRQQWRWRGLDDGPEKSTMTTEASEEED